MTEFLVGLVVGALALVPTVWVLKDRLSKTEAEHAVFRREADEAVNRLLLKLEARSFSEAVSIEALLNRPDPVPETAGRWLYDDTGLTQTFVPDVG